MRVLYFSQLKRITGKSEETIPVREPIRGDQLWDGLLLEYPALAEHRKTTRLARNCEYIPETELLHDGDEIALIPPVSGG